MTSTTINNVKNSSKNMSLTSLNEVSIVTPRSKSENVQLEKLYTVAMMISIGTKLAAIIFFKVIKLLILLVINF